MKDQIEHCEKCLHKCGCKSDKESCQGSFCFIPTCSCHRVESGITAKCCVYKGEGHICEEKCFEGVDKIEQSVRDIHSVPMAKSKTKRILEEARQQFATQIIEALEKENNAPDENSAWNQAISEAIKIINK